MKYALTGLAAAAALAAVADPSDRRRWLARRVLGRRLGPWFRRLCGSAALLPQLRLRPRLPPLLPGQLRLSWAALEIPSRLVLTVRPFPRTCESPPGRAVRLLGAPIGAAVA